MKTYYLSTMIQTTMQDARARVVTELQKEGFGVLTETDVAATLKKN